jgi:hypothetical protein
MANELTFDPVILQKVLDEPPIKTGVLFDTVVLSPNLPSAT